MAVKVIALAPTKRALRQCHNASSRGWFRCHVNVTTSVCHRSDQPSLFPARPAMARASPAARLEPNASILLMSCSFLLGFVVAQLMTNDHNTFGDELTPRRFGNRHACYPFIDNAPNVEEPFGVGLSDHLHRISRCLAHPGISSEKKPDDRILSSEHHIRCVFPSAAPFIIARAKRESC